MKKIILSILLASSTLLAACGGEAEPQLSAADRAQLARLPGQRIPRQEQARVLGGAPTASAPLVGPRSASLREKMSPVRNQYGRHTCSAFSLVALLEAAGTGPLSEQCISYLNPNGDAGYVWQTLQQVEARGFLVDAQSCPYDRLYRNHVPQELLASWQPLPLPGRAEAQAFASNSGRDPVAFIRQSLAEGAPVALSLYTFGQFWQESADSIAEILPGEQVIAQGEVGGLPYQPAHSVVAVGYDDDLGAILIRNSWGLGWKEEGYAWLTYGYLRRFHSNHLDDNPMVAYFPRR